MRKAYLILLLSAFSIIISCQEDIPVLGQDGSVDTLTEVYIRSIVLSNFPEKDPNNQLLWDEGSIQSFDSLDYKGPDIYYNFYKKSEEGHEMMYKQLSHFSNVLPLKVDSPLVYYLTEPFQIFPEYIDSTFYLRIYDLDYSDPINDSTLIDSILFAIGPDNTLTNPYITSKSGVGLNGSQVTLGLEWK